MNLLNGAALDCAIAFVKREEKIDREKCKTEVMDGIKASFAK